jgi:LCP family protein required for cell wall assembly
VPPVEEPATEHTVVRDRPAEPVPIAAGPLHPDEIKERTPALWWRFLTGAVVIIAAVATAVALSGLLAINGIAKDLQPIPHVEKQIDQVEPGEPQTILLVGSDKRANTPGDPGRSDTTMLLRVDADNNVLSLFSLPRDLKVDIPGYGTAKLNEAYTDGGINKTVATVKDLTGLKINHVVNVDFQGFADAVDAIDCVYVDVDRDYFNDNSTAYSAADEYAAIDVNAGYQRLCGQNALDYVRYRHTDNDFVRAARQQDFLRNARAQVPVGQVLPIIGGDTGSKLIDIFTKYTSSDIDDPAQLIGILKAFIGVRDVPIKEVHFKGTDTLENGIAYVTATPESIHKAVQEFLGEKDSPGGPGGEPDKAKTGGSGKKGEEKPKPEENVDSADVVPSADVVSCGDGAAGKIDAFGRTSARRLNFPVYIPESLAPNSCYDQGSRQYDIKDLDDDKQPAYKLVIALNSDTNAGEYYGVMGTTWGDPPILEKPSETREIDGRDYDLFFDGDRLRIVAFHDDDGNSYWVSNTLLQTLSEDQMLAIATSMDKKKG